MRISLILLGSLVAGLVVGCTPAVEEQPGEQAQAEETRSDEELLQDQLRDFEKAWAAGDAALIASRFVDEGDLVDPAGERFHGKQAIEGRYTELFQGPMAGSSISLTSTGTRFIGTDVAVADGKYEITGLTSEDGEALPAVKGMYTSVLVKRDGNWMIHCSRPMIPAPGTT
ncbi:MAG TPA: SgcJ/EcaC family oxidoreductase [Vicinamibacteria bacterium]|nr:SgcJ/EcaC family oxidoreductase [Vicinamibacteria bacterium]